MIYATEVIVKKIQRFTTEIKDKEYDKESVFIEHYQYEELYDQNDHDYIMLQVQNSEINLTLKTTCFGGSPTLTPSRTACSRVYSLTKFSLK